MTHDLRDLARKIEDLTKEHPAYAQASKIVANCCDHLCAVAGVHEANYKIQELNDAGPSVRGS